MYHPLSDPPNRSRTALDAGASPLPQQPTLDGSSTVDVVIVGAGFIGCTAALELAERGVRVAVLDANRIGWGSSARNGGHIPAHATKLEPWEVLEVYGEVYGPRINAAGASAPALVQETAERVGVDASIVKGGILTGAVSPEAMEKLTKRANYWISRGAPVEIHDRTSTAEFFGSSYYFGSIVDRRCIAVNSLALLYGIARAAMAKGARFYENSLAVGLSREGNGWTVQTSSGSVRCEQVLLCTNAYTDDLWPGLKETIIPVRGYQIWTKPIAESMRSQILPGLSATIGTERLPFALRLHPNGALHIGGGPGVGREAQPDLNGRIAHVKRLIPRLENIEIEGWWSGWIAKVTGDGWRIHKLAPGLFTSIGCNGRGVAMGMVMGGELAKYALAVPESELTFPITEPQKNWGYSLHTIPAKLTMRFYDWQDRRERRQAR